MKSFVKTSAVSAAILSLSASILLGQQVVQFDENGHMTVNGAVSPFAVGPDPSGGIATNVLIYQLTFLVTPGDVGLLENGSTSQNPSDLVRFFNPAGANTSEVIFYSDVETPAAEHDLADTGLPLSPNAILIPEVGPEDNNGATWAPIPGQPGSLPTGAQITYRIISDVPEPAAIPLMLAGLATWLGISRLRRNPTA